MQKKYDLFVSVLKKFAENGLLEHTILIGSWCMLFYKDFFKYTSFHPTVRTRDIDFLIPVPIKFKKKIDIGKLLESNGFVITFNQEGFMRLEHPELIIEFMVPERGKGSNKPYPLPMLGLNAQSLRFLDYLAQHSLSVEAFGTNLRLPSPAAWSLHKLIISSRRKTEEKRLKEQWEAMMVLNALVEEGNIDAIKKTFAEMLPTWKKKVISALKEEEESGLAEILTG